MVYFCLRRPGTCETCEHFRFDEDKQSKSCFAAEDEKVTLIRPKDGDETWKDDMQRDADDYYESISEDDDQEDDWK